MLNPQAAVTAAQSQDYAQLFSNLQQRLGTGAQWQAFMQNPKPALSEAGIPMIDYTEDPDPVAVASSSGLTIQKKWWGQNWIMDERLTNLLVDGIEGSAGLAEAIAIGVGIGEVLAAPLAAVVLTKIGPIKLADKGHGVCWPISWFQWAMIAASLPTAPAGVMAAAEVALWPKTIKG